MSQATSTNGPPSSLPAPPAVPTGAFSGSLVPPQVSGRIISLLIDQAPFANALTRWPTSSSKVVFPTAAPSGAAWLHELDRFPLMSMNDQAYEVAVAKLGGLVDISNEMISDSLINVTTEFGRLIGDSLSRQLDEGLLRGEGPPEPAGVIAAAPATAGADLLSAVATAVGQIGDAGGTANVLAATPSALAVENARVAEDGHLLYGPAGLAGALGLTAVAVPTLGEDVLVMDTTRLFTVVNGALSSVELSRDFRFDFDATTLRIRSRVAVAAPEPQKSIRKLTIGGE